MDGCSIVVELEGGGLSGKVPLCLRTVIFALKAKLMKVDIRNMYGLTHYGTYIETS